MMDDDDSLIGAVFSDAREKMAKAVSHLQNEFSAIRTGRASPALVEQLKVDYYGSEVPLQQIAGFNVPEPRLLVITPYDKTALKNIENDGSPLELSCMAATRIGPRPSLKGLE